MQKTIQEKREDIIRRHKELFEQTTVEERYAAHERVQKFFERLTSDSIKGLQREGFIK